MSEKKMITELTPEQEALIPVVRDEWLNLAFSLTFDEEKAVQYAKFLYRVAELDEPEVYVFDSPLALQIAANMLDANETPTREEVNRRVPITKKEDLEMYSFCSYGDWWNYGWIAFYDFFQRIGVVENELFEELKTLAKSNVFTMIQLEGVCLVSKPPVKLLKDNQDRLHCEEGPAIKFADGYEQYYWKGTCIPKHWIMSREDISDDELRTDNAELRRILIDILGVTDYFSRIGEKDSLKVIDEDTDNQGNPMTLMTFQFEGRPIQVLEVKDPSTDRIYNLYPPNQASRNVWDAKASTFPEITADDVKKIDIET